ncbi:hypothetical protein GLAREA_03721 [Glarea lozoyensis ATCC 20868]|uniref:Uncharacterized protein n=1 Tax=Glarea lozoyensis (strain ATCC 20868 / MF5171) TaxID=1116229 RepID=S3D0S7_GLAL2|nr:uncharacterized protein GLAREA_03721 [Glarea lozoyensis ATCC 20868]EPE30754.1 hypothetical protein GLAREA_03721 [Glarea lozoyensis ATCC 20868]
MEERTESLPGKEGSVWLMGGNKNENTCTVLHAHGRSLFSASSRRVELGVGDGTGVQHTKPGLGDARVSRIQTGTGHDGLGGHRRPPVTAHRGIEESRHQLPQPSGNILISKNRSQNTISPIRNTAPFAGAVHLFLRLVRLLPLSPPTDAAAAEPSANDVTENSEWRIAPVQVYCLGCTSWRADRSRRVCAIAIRPSASRIPVSLGNTRRYMAPAMAKATRTNIEKGLRTIDALYPRDQTSSSAIVDATYIDIRRDGRHEAKELGSNNHSSP